MRQILMIVLGMIFWSCQHNNQTEENRVEANTIATQVIEQQPSFPFETEEQSINYDLLKDSLAQLKLELKSALARQEISKDSVGQFFEDALVNDIIPYWYGTTWDFNGHTDTPNDGLIACGYFVSTTLRHLDMKLNRFKLAQQASLNIVKSLACGTKVYSYSNPDRKKMLAELKSNLKEGVYVVGLSNHVGFLYIKASEVYFLHSTFLEPGEVVAELASESDAFMWSDVYYLSSVSNNEKLMDLWLNSRQLAIVG